MNTFEKWFVWVTSVAAGVTGVGYFWARYLVQSSDPFSVVNHPLEPWLLKAHILLSPLLLVAVGSILVRHIWKHYRLRVVLGRKTGLVAAAVFLPMAASGYLVQTVIDPGRLTLAAWAHIGASAVFLAGLAGHQVVVHRRSRPGK